MPEHEIRPRLDVDLWQDNPAIAKLFVGGDEAVIFGDSIVQRLPTRGVCLIERRPGRGQKHLGMKVAMISQGRGHRRARGMCQGRRCIEKPAVEEYPGIGIWAGVYAIRDRQLDGPARECFQIDPGQCIAITAHLFGNDSAPRLFDGRIATPA